MIKSVKFLFLLQTSFTVRKIYIFIVQRQIFKVLVSIHLSSFSNINPTDYDTSMWDQTGLQWTKFKYNFSPRARVKIFSLWQLKFNSAPKYHITGCHKKKKSPTVFLSKHKSHLAPKLHIYKLKDQSNFRSLLILAINPPEKGNKQTKSSQAQRIRVRIHVLSSVGGRGLVAQAPRQPAVTIFLAAARYVFKPLHRDQPPPPPPPPTASSSQTSDQLQAAALGGRRTTTTKDSAENFRFELFLVGAVIFMTGCFRMGGFR